MWSVINAAFLIAQRLYAVASHHPNRIEGAISLLSIMYCKGRHNMLPGLFEDYDVSFTAHVFEYFWPDGDANFAEMCFFEYHHLSARLSDAAPDAEWNFILDYGSMIWVFEKVKLTC